MAIEGTVDYILIDLELRLSFNNWSRMLHDSPLILRRLKPPNKD